MFNITQYLWQVRLNEVSLDELVAAISAFKVIIAIEERISPAYGSLLSNLFAQLETNWRGEAFNVDIRSVQLVLLKRILGGDKCGNLVIWTAALKEIRMLSGQAREISITWALERCKCVDDESDWPVIFHNLLSISPGNEQVFEGIYECLNRQDDNNNRCGNSNRNSNSNSKKRLLLDHLIFLISQNGSLGKSWIKWILARGCFNVNALVFSGLLSLSQDIEYFNTLNEAMVNMIKVMHEIWVEVEQEDDSGMKRFCVNPEEYLEQVAGWIGCDSETGIRGALQLIDNLKIKSLSDSFYLQIYRKHPFARRQLLKKLAEFANRWRELNEIDEIILKEFVKEPENDFILKRIIKETPAMISKLFDSELELQNYLNNFTGADEEEEIKFKALMEIDSILLKRAMKVNQNLRFSATRERNNEISNETMVSVIDWKNVCVTEISLLRRFERFDGRIFVELCELLLIPSGIKEDLREDLIDLALKFVTWSEEYCERDKLIMISKLTSTSTSVISIVGRTYEEEIKLLVKGDLNKFQGSLKYFIERVSVESEEFYEMIPIISSDFHILLARAISKFEGEIVLRDEIIWLICEISQNVVSEPAYSRPFMSLLTRKYKKVINCVPISTFVEISDPMMLKAVIDFGFENEGAIEGLREELIKSLLMFYGIIDDADDVDSASEKVNIHSKFKNIHLNEKSINYALNALLADIQKDLLTAQKIFKYHVTLFDQDPDKFLNLWIMRIGKEMFPGMTRGLISGKGAIKLHGLLSNFYDLCTKMIKRLPKVADHGKLVQFKELMKIVGGQLNKQVYALIPLQQEKLQSILKQELNLKKSPGSKSRSRSDAAGKSVTNLIFEMEKFEENLIGFLRNRSNANDLEGGWSEKIVRSTARDFKIKLEQL